VFAQTQWTVVLAAARTDTTRAQQALETLCRTYWYPLYAYVRRTGQSPEDAEDLTQAFFEQLISKSYLESVDREKGRFRTFLLTALKHFLANAWDHARARKRGGGVAPISLDAAAAEETYLKEPANTLTPDKLYDRRWALRLIEIAVAAMRAEFEAEGRAEEFDRLKEFLVPEPGAGRYLELAVQIGQSEGALRLAVHRLRKRFRQVFRREIMNTVANPDEVDAEVRELLSALGD